MEVHDVAATLGAAPELAISDATTRTDVVASRRSFGRLDHYEIGGRRFSGLSPWERHPDEDELLCVTEGEVDITVLLADGETTVMLGPGCLFVVPRGLWHRQHASRTVTIWGVTATHHDEISFADDPRA